jgi:FlaA1/EpsC-like NDP-sugar epimerase
MNGTKEFSHRMPIRLILALIDDTVLILIAIYLGGYLRFWGENHYVVLTGYSFWKSIVFVLLIQIPFYYFDLYRGKNFRATIKMAVTLLESLTISFLLLSILYYLIPVLAVGRGLLGIGLILIWVFAFLDRFLYVRICGSLIKERILIVGTGEMSKKIIKEIYENGKDDFEIIGFVGE